jgi:uncharacterized protein
MKNRSFLLIHGLGGSGPQHWQTWLHGQLRERNADVHYPTFSNYDAPDREVWMQELRAAWDKIPADHEVTVIAHSLGCILWMHYGETAPLRSADQVILVAPPSSLRVIPEVAPFYPVPLHSASLAKVANETLFVLSTDDPYCSLEDAVPYLRLGAPANVLPNMGHINTDSGHGEWPWILEQCGV